MIRRVDSQGEIEQRFQKEHGRPVGDGSGTCRVRQKSLFSMLRKKHQKTNYMKEKRQNSFHKICMTIDGNFGQKHFHHLFLHLGERHGPLHCDRSLSVHCISFCNLLLLHLLQKVMVIDQ